MKVFITRSQRNPEREPSARERMNSLKLLGERLQLQMQLAGTMHVNRPEEVELLCQLSWDGVNDFAKHYGMKVRCRGRGAAFDFSPCASG